MTTTDEVMITAPKLAPFTHMDKLTCPKCGQHISLWEHITMFLFHGSILAIFRVRYCNGGMTPPSEEPTSAHPLAEIISTLERRPKIDNNTCLGIGKQHLHVTCKDCDYEMLMETAPVKNRGTDNAGY